MAVTGTCRRHDAGTLVGGGGVFAGSQPRDLMAVRCAERGCR